MDTIITAVSTLGFPIVMCGALFWYMIQQRKDHKEEVEKLTTALENNTVAVTKLTDYIKGE